MDDMANPQLPLPIVLAFAGFLLSILFPDKIHPISATGVGFVAGIVIVRLIDQLFDRLSDLSKEKEPVTGTVLKLRRPVDHRL